MDEQQVNLPSIEKPPTLRARVYEILRQRILDGELEPGYRLREAQLAEQLNVSRTPVREAIQRLRVEGLVSSSSRGHAKVEPISSESIADAMDVRQVLEAFACRLAASRVSDRHIERLRSLHASELRALETSDLSELSSLNRSIHQTIQYAAGNQVLEETVNHLLSRVPSYGLFALGETENLQVFVQSHGKIIEAIAKGDEDAAASEIISHIALAKEILLSNFREAP